jgi:hypothetical protein
MFAMLSASDPLVTSSGERIIVRLALYGVMGVFVLGAIVAVRMFPNRHGAIAKGLIVVGVAGLLLAALANWELLPVNRGAGAVGGLFGGAGALFAGIWLNKR